MLVEDFGFGVLIEDLCWVDYMVPPLNLSRASPGKDMDELESTEKIYVHRVLPVGDQFGCQDCKQVTNDLMALVTKPCVKETCQAANGSTPLHAVRVDLASPLPPSTGAVAPEAVVPLSVGDEAKATASDPVAPEAVVEVSVGVAAGNAVSDPVAPEVVPASFGFSAGNSAEDVGLLEEEYAALLAEEELLEELAILESLHSEQSRLEGELMEEMSLMNSNIPASSDIAPYPHPFPPGT